MKAIEFMKAHAEMHDYYGGVIKGCTRNGEKCPLADIECDLPRDNMTVAEAENMQAIVEKWVNRNEATNGAKFAEIFGIDFMDVWTLCDVNAKEWANQRYEK